jgi:uncharacterized delta-60 repeat protein
MSIAKATRSLTPFVLALLGSCSAKQPASLEPEPLEEPEPETSAFELRVADTKVPVVQGADAEVTVQVVRKGDFHGAVQISALELPEGTTLAPATIAADSDAITLLIRAADDAPHSLPSAVELVGTANELESTLELTVTVCGHPGALDTSFRGGRSVVPVGAGDDYASALALTNEGKIIVAGGSAENLGDIALVRLERDGGLDATFGEGGKVNTSLGSGSDVARAVALQSDGKIVVAGATTNAETGLDFVIVRYLPDGRLDSSFGDAGKTVVSLSEDSDGANALLVQEDGKLVAAGSANRGASASGVDFALVRLNTDGSLDESFGDGGSVLTPIASNAATDVVYSLASHHAGGEERVIAAGGEGDFTLARYTANGELDASFGNGGIVSGVLGSVIGAARAVRATRDGKLVVAGHHSHDFALARFDASGELDAEFGNAGTVITPISEANWDEAQGLAVDAEGKLVAGGWTYEASGSSGNFALARYSADGVLDAGFGDHGVVITEVAATAKNDTASGVLLQADDRIPTLRVLLAGSASSSNHDFAVTRYWR